MIAAPHAAARPAVEHSAAIPALPARIKALYVTTLLRSGAWLRDALTADDATQIHLDEVVGVTAGLARLRDEAFDAVLVSHEPGVLDAMEMVAGLRAGGHDEPILVLGNQPSQHVDAVCFEAGADDYCSIAETTVRGLLWKLARAMERSVLVRENRRLVQAERQRLAQEHREAERLLEQQRAILCDLEILCDGATDSKTNASGDEEPLQGSCHPEVGRGVGPQVHEPDSSADVGMTVALVANASRPPRPLPAALVDHYRELLRAYVIMGAGNLAHELSNLAELLAEAGVSSQHAMRLHVDVLEELVAGLGNRSARHVMNRADLLALEVVGQLADGYRRRWDERLHPPRQRLLPGFLAAA